MLTDEEYGRFAKIMEIFAAARKRRNHLPPVELHDRMSDRTIKKTEVQDDGIYQQMAKRISP